MLFDGDFDPAVSIPPAVQVVVGEVMLVVTAGANAASGRNESIFLSWVMYTMNLIYSNLNGRLLKCLPRRLQVNQSLCTNHPSIDSA